MSDALKRALERIAGFSLSQFMGPHDMALECVNVAIAALSHPEPEPEAVQVPLCVRTAPERIWLQADINGMRADDPFENDGVTWCAESVGGTEVEYVRVDLAAAPQPPAQAEADAGDWSIPTTKMQRMSDAVTLLCAGKRPGDYLVQSWIDGTDDGLQDFAATHGPSWAQGIGLLDAAAMMADQPTEGVEHEGLPQTQAEARGDEWETRVLGADEAHVREAPDRSAAVAAALGIQRPAPAAPQAGESDRISDLRERITEAHDASLDDDHRACRSILMTLLSEIDAHGIGSGSGNGASHA